MVVVIFFPIIFCVLLNLEICFCLFCIKIEFKNFIQTIRYESHKVQLIKYFNKNGKNVRFLSKFHWKLRSKTSIFSLSLIFSIEFDSNKYCFFLFCFLKHLVNNKSFIRFNRLKILGINVSRRFRLKFFFFVFSSKFTQLINTYHIIN